MTVRAAQRPQPDEALADLADAHEEALVHRIELHLAQDLHQRAEPDVPEQISRRFRALLPGFVNLRSGHRFGKGQRGIFHQHPPHQRDEQHAQHAAHRHQRGRFPIRVRRIEGSPRSRDQKRGQREHRARRDRFADGPGGSRDVLFQNRPFHMRTTAMLITAAG